MTAMVRMENHPSLAPLLTEIKTISNHYNSPLKVAVVGLIKAGKSTLINGLIKENLLVTNHEEATYTITHFKYNEKPELTIVFKDGSSIAEPMDRLDFWTSRKYLNDNERLNDVETVVIGYPNEIFKKIEIIDTPGLGSVYGVDSENTQDFLGSVKEADSEKSTLLTQSAMAKADAIICAFRGNLRKSNLETVEEFLKHFGENGDPSNSIGVFTRCDDAFWQEADADPCEVAANIIQNNYMQRSEIRRVLYALLPVAALPVQNVFSMDSEQYGWFQKLSEVDDGDLFELCSNAEIFCDMDIGEFVINQEQRRQLFKTYGRYGIYLITKLVREGHPISQIQDIIFDKCGISSLMDLIINHFGNRAHIIKAQIVLTRLKALLYEYNIGLESHQESERSVLDDLYGACDDLLTQEHCFRELVVLKSYYNKGIVLSNEDEEDLLCLTGEYGYQCEARLGVEQGKYSLEELKQIVQKKMDKWRSRANSPLTKRNEQKLAEVLKRSCEIIYYHLEALTDY